MSISPLRAFTGTPSISMLTRSSAMQVSLVRAAHAAERAHSLAREAPSAVIDHVFELVPVMLEEALHRPGRRIPERTDGVPSDAVPDIEQQRKLLAPRRAGEHPLQQPVHPARALAAR